MGRVAKIVNHLTGGRLKPNTVTIVGLLAHVPIAWLIAERQFILGALLLIVFGLFDTLDGELARLQGTTSALGMLLDSTTDRMKEVILYIGIAFALVFTGHTLAIVWIVAACGGSLLVSYINAWGEVAIANSNLYKHKVNQSFRGGFLRFEVRMFALVIGLLLNQLVFVVALLTVLSFYTALQRLNLISDKLHNTDVKS